MEQTKEIDIDLRKIFYMMRTKVIWIVIITIVTTLLSGMITHFFIAPTYSATVKMYVYSNTDRISTDTTITSNEITASQQLVNTYIYVLESDTVLDKVADNLGIDETSSSLKKMISASQVEETEAFQVTVTTTDKNLSAKIANSIAEIAPDEIVRVVKAGGVEIIDYAKVPKNPSSPNTKKNLFIGAFAGFILSFFAFFIYELFDTTITNARDVEREFELPVLGTVPKLEPIETSTSFSAVDSSLSSGISISPSETLLQNISAMKGDGKDE